MTFLLIMFAICIFFLFFPKITPKDLMSLEHGEAYTNAVYTAKEEMFKSGPITKGRFTQIYVEEIRKLMIEEKNFAPSNAEIDLLIKYAGQKPAPNTDPAA
jgi:hypothetical protein